MLGEECNACSSALCNFPHYPVISSVLTPNNNCITIIIIIIIIIIITLYFIVPPAFQETES